MAIHQIGNDLHIRCSDAKYEYISEFVVRSSAKLTINSSQSDIVTSMPCWALPRNLCH